MRNNSSFVNGCYSQSILYNFLPHFVKNHYPGNPINLQDIEGQGQTKQNNFATKSTNNCCHAWRKLLHWIAAPSVG